jgi:hypothetical protein
MKIKILVFILLFPLFISAQNLLINKTDSGFIINERILSSKGKTCRLINYVSKDYIPFNAYSFKPLIIIKIFNNNQRIETLPRRPNKLLDFHDYVKGTIIPTLNADMLSRIDVIGGIFHGATTNIFDSLILHDGKTYQYIPGVIVVEFFNLLDFDQLNILQTNQTIINTKAKIAPIYSWVQDSLPLPDIPGNVKVMPNGKIFSLKKKGNDYIFFRWPFDCSDCTLNFYNEYVYRKDYGIIAFKSKYLFLSNNKFSPEKIGESREYYYFR